MVRSLQGYCSSGCQVSLHAKSRTNRTSDHHRFSQTYPEARFFKLDVDEVPDVAQELGVRAMPTFLLFKDGDKIAEVVGANPKALEAAIKSNL